MIKLKDIVDIELFKYDLEREMIVESVYPKDKSYSIFCYSRQAQLEGYWNPKTTVVTRGLVIKKINDKLEDAVVIARGMNKFFTVDQVESDWGKLKLVDDDENVTVQSNYFIDFNSPAYIVDKIDGALGIAVPINNDYVITTKGSFTSLEGEIGNKILHTKYDSKVFYEYIKKNYPNYTPLFEIVTPQKEHVIDYGELEDIIFLGLVDNKTGKWYPNIPLNIEFKRPKFFGVKTLLDALQMPDIEGREGLVITILNEDRDIFKIKYKSYLKLREYVCSDMKLKTLVTKELPVSYILKEKDLPLPPLLKERYTNKVKEKYYRPIKEESFKTLEIFLKIAPKYDLTSTEGKKQFAEEVKALDIDSRTRAVLFSLKEEIIKTAVEATRKLY